MAQAPRPVQRSDQRPPQRQLLLRTGSNRFELELSNKPEGMDYGWKRFSLHGQEDTENMINCEMNEWVPVPAERHPELSGRRAVAGTEIRRGGQILMERPAEITEEARDLDTFAARNQVASQIQRLGLEGKRVNPKGIKTSYEVPREAGVVED
jgi:hypothetical protein